MPKCKDCIHSEICASHLKAVRDIYGAVMSISGREVNHLESALSEVSTTIGQICCDDCGHFKDRSRFVELPCKVGDTIYRVKDGKVTKEQVVEFGISSRGVVLYRTLGYELGYSDYFGNSLFFSKEEAEQSLKERENNAGRNDV